MEATPWELRLCETANQKANPTFSLHAICQFYQLALDMAVQTSTAKGENRTILQETFPSRNSPPGYPTSSSTRRARN